MNERLDLVDSKKMTFWISDGLDMTVQIQDVSQWRIGQREDWADWAHGRDTGTDPCHFVWPKRLENTARKDVSQGRVDQREDLVD